MGDQLVAGGSLLSKVQIGVARISSRDRLPGISSANPFNEFTCMLTPQISRCIGFYVQSISIHNDWFTIDDNHNVSYWSKDGGTTIVKVTIPAGYYDAILTATDQIGKNVPGVQFAAELNAAIEDALSIPSDDYITYDGRTNTLILTGGATFSLTYYSGNNTDPTLQTATSTLGPIVGFSNGQSSPNNISPVFADDSLVIDRFDPPYVNINSYQLRQPNGFDTRQPGGTNAFLHMRIDVPKLAVATFEVESPTEYTVIKLPGPQEFQQLQFSVTNPQTGEKMDMGRNWEMVICFLCVAAG